MKYTTVALFYLLFAFLSINSLSAQQDIPIGTEKIIIDGKEYYLHKVRKSEGLYRISVTYGVSQKEILEVNPSAAFGLKLGQIIKVPVIKGRNSTEEQLQNEPFIYHTVEQGQTAYYIAKRYRVELQDIYNNNPGSERSLLEGAIIKIPKKEVRHIDNTINEDGYYIHKVEPKETLFGIAKRYRLSINDILKHNEGLESGVLKEGTFIRIPVDVAEAKPVVEQEIIDGTEDDKFIYHKIKSGETLFSISEKYNAKSQDVILANKSISTDDMPIGYLVRIPKNSIKQAKQNPFENAVLINHKIRKRERLYDVVDKYGVPSDIIEKVNAAEGIDLTKWEKGMIIKVPTKKWVEQYYERERQVEMDKTLVETKHILPFEKMECDQYDYSLTRPSIKVGMLLPFNVEATERLNYKTEEVDGEEIKVERENRRLSMRSKVFVEFYQGALLALEALKQEGVNVDLFVYDTSPDTTKVMSLLEKPEMKYFDLIIGPAYSANLKHVSEFSKQYDIPMVYPLSTTNEQMDKNPLLFQANPSDTLMFDRMARRMIQSSMGKRLVIIRTENKDNEYERSLSQLIRDRVYWESFKNGEVPDFVEYRFKQDDLASLERMLDTEKENVVIIPSVQEAQVNRIVTTLKGAAERTKTNVTLWGLPDWMKYNTVNPEDIHKLNGHIFSYYAVDYRDALIEDRIKSYRHWFKTEPIAISPFFQAASVQSNMSRYSLWGHDVTYYFISAIRDYGKNFPHCIQHHHPHTLQSKLNFMRVSNWGGFYNHGLFVVKFSSDFKVEIEEIK